MNHLFQRIVTKLDMLKWLRLVRPAYKAYKLTSIFGGISFANRILQVISKNEFMKDSEKKLVIAKKVNGDRPNVLFVTNIH